MGHYTSVAMTLAFYDVPAGATGMARSRALQGRRSPSREVSGALIIAGVIYLVIGPNIGHTCE